ncbi:helicase-related protein [Saccharibacter floricola]|uniref:Helicase domain-containing protein n=1 Tax=Saccharibacter floricola DSM 15669 TaxID=1123227 RepID=A0ABQ0P0L4_9PROT|nr:helicase-related protein [Saccharibacter floricola]GBQ08181.1 helicase domain-containing protein [Saccharibacter floricola DSM 15669]
MAMTLENLKNGARVKGILSSHIVTVIATRWIGNTCVEVTHKSDDNILGETILFRDNESELQLEESGKSWSFSGDGALLRLVIEAYRMRLACFFDPYLAIHTSLIDPLPHQISAVYKVMLPRQPLRFLLADDPGAGKTIMAGLFAKELKARSDLERCMIVAPGSLVEQWQDELGQKFGLEFTIFSREMTEASRIGNPFENHHHLIVRLDMLARNDDLQQKFQQAKDWDLIICDEAHRMSASYFGGEIRRTKRYTLGQTLGKKCRNFLLMSATPHNGKPEDFQLFMALLDSDRFEGRFRDGDHSIDSQDMMRRLTKEELLRFDGRPLFPERRARTVSYHLSKDEAELYTAVSNYVRDEMNRVERFASKKEGGKKRNNVGFALQILQRRLASSPSAIYQSLKRRRNRLEEELGEAQLRSKRQETAIVGHSVSLNSHDYFEDSEEYTQGDIDKIEDTISTGATSSETLEELEKEVETLKMLEARAQCLVDSGEDKKWVELQRILDDPLMRDEEGNYRKLIVFTEAKDTLFYLWKRIKSYVGRVEAVAVIHGGVTREERRKVVERFMQDKQLRFLIANDAAGEGVNLQRGHLMVNYDLPWNPNKIEQRFGRIHRIGQTEVCHLWNLVASETREGAVYARLLEKLEAARLELNDRVYDVLGELFEGTSLKDLLCEAIKYGEERRDQLFRIVDKAVDQSTLLDLLKRRALTEDTMSTGIVTEIREEMERAEVRRLQPHHVESYFLEAFKQLGGRIKLKEEGRWEITRVPSKIREQDRQMGKGEMVQMRYERICFDKSLINRQPVATFIYPGHPLMEAVTSLIREQYGTLLKQGAVMVDESDDATAVSVLYLLEGAVKDGVSGRHNQPNIISRQLQFVSVASDGSIHDAGHAPHLNLRPATAEEIASIEDGSNTRWNGQDLEQKVLDYAIAEVSRRHVDNVKSRRLPELEKTEREVKARLEHEINYWDCRALTIGEDERRGQEKRMNVQNARRRAEELAERLECRLKQLEKERSIQALSPKVCGGMLVIPKGYLRGKCLSAETSADAEARRCVEVAAMEAVMEAERKLGNSPKDVSAERNLGYDILSETPEKVLRCIEVKGRIEGADTVTLTREELMASLNVGERFILALVFIKDNGKPKTPLYRYGAVLNREPGFAEVSVSFNLKKILERAIEPS